ncbi:MAG: hypothetical protein ACKVOP_08065 [Sphingomonadaceae bacterium]
MVRQLLLAGYAFAAAIGIATPAIASPEDTTSPDDEAGWGDADAAPVSDAELAEMTGKFVLPNGVEFAMSVVSDTVVDGQLALRTVLTVDQTARVDVFGRQGGGDTMPYVGVSNDQPGTVAATGVSVMLDRRSGTQTVTPTFGVTNAAKVASAPIAANDAAARGLTLLPVTPGGEAVATDHGHVTIATTERGSQVTLSTDQLGVAHVVGQYIATAIVNSANNRIIDTVTNINIDLRDVAPYSVGSAMLQIDGIARDVAIGLSR